MQALAAPISEAFGFNYGGGVTSQQAAYNAKNQIATIPDIYGYKYDSRAFIDNNAYYVRRDMGGDALFTCLGHANAGLMACAKLNGVDTLLTAYDVSYMNNVYSLQLRYAGTSELRDLKLAIFMGCYTSNTDLNYGNLPDYAVRSLGVDVALGWSGQVSFMGMEFYINKFYYYCSLGYSIGDAHDLAYRDMFYTIEYDPKYGYGGGTGNVVYFAQSGIGVYNYFIKPAAYGNGW